MELLPTVWLLWSQVPAANPSVVPFLALQRWISSQTLSSPQAISSRLPIWAWLGGMSALLIAVLIVQGPKRAATQLFDIPGLARLFSAAVVRLRRAGRLIAALLGTTVLAWTTMQARSFNAPERLEGLAVLLKTKSLAEFAVEQGFLAALTPLRDVFGLGDTVILLVAAAILVFKYSADRWSSMNDEGSPRHNRLSNWTTPCWGGAWLYVFYRIGTLVADRDGLPLGGCFFVEAGVVPVLMAMADGLLLAWVLRELSHSSAAEAGDGFDVEGTISLFPAVMVACVAGMPARVVATSCLLALPYLPTGVSARPWLTLFAWGWGLAGLQAVSFLTSGLAGAVVWTGGSMRHAVKGYVQILRLEGGHLASFLFLASAASGTVSALAYFVVLSLPSQPWILTAADSYAHYASLPIGLVLLSAFVELGYRARLFELSPTRGIEREAVPEPATEVVFLT